METSKELCFVLFNPSVLRELQGVVFLLVFGMVVLEGRSESDTLESEIGIN